MNKKINQKKTLKFYNDLNQINFSINKLNKLIIKYKNKEADFEKKYINLLKAGGSKNYTELLKPFNLDITKKNFWTQSISVVNDLIDELESII